MKLFYLDQGCNTKFIKLITSLFDKQKMISSILQDTNNKNQIVLICPDKTVPEKLVNYLMKTLGLKFCNGDTKMNFDCVNDVKCIKNYKSLSQILPIIKPEEVLPIMKQEVVMDNT